MRALLAGEALPVFDEAPEAHRARCHPDPEATRAERKDLEARLARRVLGAREVITGEVIDRMLAKTRGAYREDEDS